MRLKQQNVRPTTPQPANSRESMIGQRWQLKADSSIWRVYQHHHKDRKVALVPDELTATPQGPETVRVAIKDLRSKYRRLKPNQTRGQG